MTQNTKPISPLRRRMIEDMMLRKLSPQTQAAYIHAVKSCVVPASVRDLLTKH
ncbi:MAG: hypothetical protein U9P00_00460 [Pseudomonadota bacterium]|nr:hypothetical protein [Pseudomonadota bacterium]